VGTGGAVQVVEPAMEAAEAAALAASAAVLTRAFEALAG
jgi:L-lactate dehydrogenase